MISRVTQQTSMLAAQRNLQSSAAQLAKLQEQGMTRKAFSRASEDPSGAADAMRIRAQQRANDQYSRNIDNGLGWVTTIDSTLTEVNDAMKRVRDLTVQGANDGALSPTAKEAIAVELDGLREQLLGLANTQYLGRSVFAGNSSAGAAFNPDFSFTGAAGSTVERRIGADTTVRVDGDGAAAFGVGANSVFALVEKIAADLRSGTNIGASLGDIDTRMNALRTEQSAVGSRHALIMRAEETVMDKTGSLEAQRAAVEDIELSRIILDLKAQEISYQAALGVTARVLQPTLMDFLR
jgi:flagellar hook-associated protein 3 FlgL